VAHTRETGSAPAAEGSRRQRGPDLRPLHRSAAFAPAVAGAALVLLAAAGPAAFAQAPPPTSGFAEVEVDLAGQMFTNVLPFDVPFIIYGAVPAGITELEVRCWKLTEVKVKGRRVPQPADLAGHPDGDCPLWDGPLNWRNTIDPNAPSPTFRLLLPRLDAESTYQFKFSYDKKVTPEEAQEFATRVEAVVSEVAWGTTAQTADLPLSGDLTDAQLAELRERLTQALKEVTGGDRFPDCERSKVFCEAVSPQERKELSAQEQARREAALFAAVRDELNAAVRPVRDAQGKITAAITDYQNEVSDLNALLARVRSDASLSRLKAGLDAMAAANPTFGPQAKTVGDVVGLPDLPQLLARDRQSPAALAEFLTATAQALSAAGQDLAALQSFLGERLVNPQGAPQPIAEQLLAAGSLTAADLPRLQQIAQPAGTLGSALRGANRLGQNIVPVRLESALADRAAAVAEVGALYRTRVQNMVLLAGSTTGDFATQHKNYVSADTGVAWAPGLDAFPVYVGTNIYFRPVNKAAALSQFGNFWQTLSRRTSVTLGLTANGVGDGKTREDLFSNQSLVLGLGVRLTNSVRLTGGALVFLKKDPNPLVDRTREAVTPFLSLSFDIDVAPTLQGIGGLFKPGG
jgi:hypothetical protein